MSKTLKTGLTGSGKRRDGTALVECVDALHEKWKALQTLAGLLESCRNTPMADLEPEIIGHAGRLMLDELGQMHRTLQRLEKEIAAS
jgi:hypothetical protein